MCGIKHIYIFTIFVYIIITDHQWSVTISLGLLATGFSILWLYVAEYSAYRHGRRESRG
jgi:multisubunit Na+/H+ antiporter MnhC subunit